MNVITLIQNIFIKTLKYKHHSSPSLYFCLFIWGQLDYRRHGNGLRIIIYNMISIFPSCRRHILKFIIDWFYLWRLICSSVLWFFSKKINGFWFNTCHQEYPPPHIPKRPKMLKNAFHSPNFVKISWAILQSFPPTAFADSFLEVFLQHSRMEKNSRLFEVYFLNSMVITCESWIPPSPNLDKVAVSFDKLNNHCMIMCMKRTKSKVKII